MKLVNGKILVGVAFECPCGSKFLINVTASSGDISHFKLARCGACRTNYEILVPVSTVVIQVEPTTHQQVAVC